MVKMTRDRVTGLIAIGVAFFIFFMSMRLPASMILDDPGPGAFPIIACVIMFLCGIGLIIPKPVETDKKGKSDKPYFNRSEWKRFIKILGAYILYTLLQWLFGFIPASLVTLFIVSSMFLEGKKVVIWKQVVITVVVTFAIFVSFQLLLGLRLPQGILLRLDF